MSSESTPRADVSPLPNPVSPPGTPTTGSALVQKANEMRARAVGVLAALDESREVDRRAKRYKPVTTTVGDAEQLARDVVALTESVVGLSADVTRLEAELEGVHLALAEANVERAGGDDEPLWSEQYRVRLLYGQRDAAEVRVKELEHLEARLRRALRTIAQLGGDDIPESDCLRVLALARGFASAVAYDSTINGGTLAPEIARLAEALPLSVVPVEDGTGTVSGQEQAAPDGEEKP